MNKHRIIGLVVLIAVAVVVAQYCLNYYKGNHYHLQTYRSPPVEPLKPAMLAPENAPQIQASETLVADNADLPAQGSIAVSAWIVQVAIVSKESSAQRLLGQLKELGFNAFTSSVSLQGKAVYRVSAGPFTQQTLAVDALTVIQEKLRMTGILKQYTVQD